MAESEQERNLRERYEAHMKGDYIPNYGSTTMPTPEARTANAAEYAAHQLGKINQSLAKLVAILEKRGV